MNIPTVNLKKTGLNIKKLRAQAGMSVSVLQDALGFSTPQAIYKWQRGDTLPTVDNLVILSSVLHVKIDDILVVD